MTFDTNILIAYLDKEESVFLRVKALKETGTLFFLPAMVEAELLSYAKWTAEQRATVERFLEESFIFVPFDRTIARITAKLRRELKLKSADATIAATSLFTNTPLLTRNTRDFKRIDSLQLISL